MKSLTDYFLALIVVVCLGALAPACKEFAPGVKPATDGDLAADGGQVNVSTPDAPVDSGQGSPIGCVSDSSCQPTNRCHVGRTSCDAAGGASCRDTNMFQANGTVCGAGSVCQEGVCAACPLDMSCSIPTNPCRAGAIVCATGAPVCAERGNMPNGTACGMGRVCHEGVCSACTNGASCSPTNPCHKGTIDCSNGTVTCTDSATNVVAGTACGAGKLCNDTGACVACVAGATCAVDTQPPVDAAIVDSGTVDAAIVDSGTVQVADASDDHAKAADATADSGQPVLCPALDFNLLCGCAVDGKIQCDGTCSTDDATCVPTGQFYVITNLFLGDGRPLDTYGPPGMEAFMATQLGTSGQRWSITASPDGTFRLANMAAGPTLSLESSPDGKKLFMATSNDSPAQKWHIRSLGNVSIRRFRILNVLAGTARSLDTSTVAPNSPFLNMNGDYSGEFWKLTKAP